MDIEVGGQIQGISLGSFLQIVNMDKTTCTLKIYSNDDIGYLYLKDGALVAAETGHLANVEAAYEILSWNKTVIIIDNAPIPNQNIKIPLMSILMEGLRRKDEKNAQMGFVPEEVERKELEIEFDPDTYQSKDDQIMAQFVVSDSKEPEPPVVFDDTEKTEQPPKFAEKPIEQIAPPDLPLEALAEVSDVPTESVSKVVPAETESPFFEDEDAQVTKKPKTLSMRIGRLALIAVIASAMVFGGLHLYNIYLDKSAYNRIIDQVKAQKDLETMKKVLSAYINTQKDSDKYLADSLSKMNDLNDLIKVENTINGLSLDDQYKDKALGLYEDFLKERRGTFLEDYINKRLKDIPKSLEAYEFKKLSSMGNKSRNDRMKAYKSFIASYPESKEIQNVQNLIAALSDDAYAELAACTGRSTNLSGCIGLCDAFLKDFPEDGRSQEIMELRKKLSDQLSFNALKAKTASMDFDPAKKMFIDYMANNPESTVKKEIREEIANLNIKIELQAKWDETSTYCRNPQFDISQRIRELKDYMDRDTSGYFRRQADALMRDLKQEEKYGQARMAEIMREREERDRYAKIQAERDRIVQERDRIRQSESARKAREQKLNDEARRLSRAMDNSNGRFNVNQDRTVIDKRTGLMWSLVDSYGEEGSCMDYDSALDYVRNLKTGGYRDWRLPDPGELAVLYNSRPYYPSSGASWYWTIRSTSDAWSDKAAVFYPNRKDEFEQVYKNKSDCGYIHAVRP
jgi:hypothetical protein